MSAQGKDDSVPPRFGSDTPSQVPKERIKGRTIIGLVLTFTWLIGFGLLTLLWEPPVRGNEWGDWAAGMFAPVAFGWLVLGYFQQGEELRDNVRALHLQEEALRLQVQELKESVEQQTEVAKAASRQADMLEKSQEIALRSQVLQHQPRFKNFFGRDRDNSEPHLLRISAANIGKPCYDIVVEYKERENGKTTEPVGGHWGTDTELTFSVGPPPHDTSIVSFTLRYTDELLVRQTQAFQVILKSEPQSGDSLAASLDHMSFNLPTSLDDLTR